MQAITEKTLVPMGLLFSVLGIFFGGVWWAASLHSRVVSAEERVTGLEMSNKDVVKELKTVNETLIRISVTLDNTKSK
jgi:hypothetical protein